MENKPTRKRVHNELADKIAMEMKEAAQDAIMNYLEKNHDKLDKFSESGDVIQAILMAVNGITFETLLSCDDARAFRQESKQLLTDTHEKAVELLFKIRENNQSLEQ